MKSKKEEWRSNKFKTEYLYFCANS